MGKPVADAVPESAERALCSVFQMFWATGAWLAGVVVSVAALLAVLLSLAEVTAALSARLPEAGICTEKLFTTSPLVPTGWLAMAAKVMTPDEAT